MRMCLYFMLVLGLGFFWPTSSAPAGGFPVSFQADYADISNGEETTGKYYASSQGLRTEGIMDGQQQIMIVNFDQRVVWVVMEEEGMYYEMAMGPEESDEYMSVCAELTEKETMVGQETLHGRSVEKWHCRKMDGRVDKVWFDPRLQTALRTQDAHGAIFELRNIREKRLSSDLFQPPQEYQKVSMPGMQFGGQEPPDAQDGGGGFFGGGFPGAGQDEYPDDEDDAGMLDEFRGIFGR